MDVIYEWVRPIIYFSLFITILLQILPSDKYMKYIRFFVGLLMIVLVMSPLLNLFSKEDISEQIFDGEFYQEQEEKMDIDFEELERQSKVYYEKVIEESLAEESDIEN